MNKVIYKNDGKWAFFDGLKFTRDDRTGYYLNSTHSVRLHRYIWECCHGKIMKGFHIHHKDMDKSNNQIENLEMLDASTHEKIHGRALTEEQKKSMRLNLTNVARPKASEWHKSSKGKEWHRKHYEKMKDKFHTKHNFICKQCEAEFTSTNLNSKFCSNKCKSKWRKRSGIDNEKKECEYCGTEFTTNKYYHQRTCSGSCANRLRACENKEYRIPRTSSSLQHGSRKTS